MAEERDMAEGIQRRSFLRGAATVAWATPLILTMTAHPAGAQTSCLPNGGPCNACEGMRCCDADPPDDGGCCCADPNLNGEPGCAGVCMAVDADCEALPSIVPDETLLCYVPPPAGFAAGRMAASGKGPKSR
ncbi:MAG TPA: hypothetical protein VIG64_05805 [Actinomycetota bacterium]|jgi:hypothetical protein